jgi:hypothetical protein
VARTNDVCFVVSKPTVFLFVVKEEEENVNKKDDKEKKMKAILSNQL